MVINMCPEYIFKNSIVISICRSELTLTKRILNQFLVSLNRNPAKQEK